MAYSRTGFTVQTNGQTLVVTATRNGATSTLYSDAAVTSSVTLPHTITSDTTYYVAEAGYGTQIVSVKQPDGSELWGKGLDCYAYTGIQTIAPLPTEAQVAADIIQRGAFLPSGALAQNMSRIAAMSNLTATLSTGRMSLTALDLPLGRTITSISFMAATTALSAGTNQWFALYDSSRALLRQTADDTSTAWSANSVKTLTLTTPFTTTYSGLHYVGINVTASTVPTLFGINANANPVNIAPRLNGTADSSLTDTAPATAAAINATATVPWVYVS